MNQTRLRNLLLVFLATVAVLVAQDDHQTAQSVVSRTRQKVNEQTSAQPPASQPISRTWTPPDSAKIPAGSSGESILLGMHIFEETPKYAPAYVGNQLSCTNCHLQGGTMSYGIALVGAPSWFPMFSERAKRDISLEDRIQECVTRSENGTPLPHGGTEMTALISYFEWLSHQRSSSTAAPARGLASLPSLEGNPVRGATIYKEQCSTCHGDDGAGVPRILPALWGPDAYNDGAGMNQVRKMAAFVLRNMPQNNPGTLTPQQAYDVAAYVASKPHSSYNRAYDIY
jgi:thiosulfate dehydrogenase